LFDSKTSQHKNLTVAEIRQYREQLCKHLEEQAKKARSRAQWQDDLARKQAEAAAELFINREKAALESQRRVDESFVQMRENLLRKRFGM
jgi:hypothetical protein